MSEANIAQAGNNELDRRGAYHFPTTGVAIAGTPDRTACYRGHYIAIEYKKPGQHPRPNQQHHLNRIQRAGGHAIVAHSRQDVRDLLNRIDAQLDSTEAA